MQKTAVTLTILLGLITLWIAKSFLVPILFGASIAALLARNHERLQCRMSSRWAAALLTFSSAVLVILPMTLLIVTGVRAAAEKVKHFRETAEIQGTSNQNLTTTLIQVPSVEKVIGKAGRIIGMEPAEVIRSAEATARRGGLLVADVLAKVAQKLPQLTIELFLVLLAIFFTLVDGHRLARFLRENSPFPHEETGVIMSTFHELCRSVMLATLVSGFAQATTYLIGLVIVGASAIPLITLLVFLTSFIPLFGSSPITLGFAAYTFFAIGSADGLILLITAGVTGIVDNFVKPAVLKGAANMHPLITLVALFGGLEVFGFTGLFLGPIFVGLFLVTLGCMVRIAAHERARAQAQAEIGTPTPPPAN